jgi:hypothetical protein
VVTDLASHDFERLRADLAKTNGPVGLATNGSELWPLTSAIGSFTRCSVNRFVAHLRTPLQLSLTSRPSAPSKLRQDCRWSVHSAIHRPDKILRPCRTTESPPHGLCCTGLIRGSHTDVPKSASGCGGTPANACRL